MLLAAGAVYAGSEGVRRATWPKRPMAVLASRDPEAIPRGARLATRLGCHDCHGADLTGRLFHDEPPIARITGANLTLAVAQQSDAELARAIRTGVAADGRGLFVMPSAAFSQLTDAETADLLAYLRTTRPTGVKKQTLRIGPLGRLGVVLGKFRSEPALLADGAKAPDDLGPEHREGRALSRLCMECHGQALEGSAIVKSPDLAIAASYSLADFTRLMRTGVASADRELPMMSPTARARFTDLSDAEIARLHAYLQARAEVDTAAPKASSK
jgi:cytochrome c553